MLETVSPAIEWQKGTNDLEYFSSLTYEQLLAFLDNEENARYYASEVLYLQESKVYRNGLPVREETKIMFVIGDGINRNMRLTKDFTGKYIRTKQEDGRDAEKEARKKLQRLHYKAAEADEVRAALSFYLDGENGIDSAMAFAEISDVFYNLFHLEITDSENKKQYELWIEALQKVLGINQLQAVQLVSAKYHHRMFNNAGANGFKQEDENIATLIKSFYGEAEEVFIKQRVSNFLTMADILFDRVLVDRLKKLRINYQRQEKDELEDSKTLEKFNISKEWKRKIGKFLRGERKEINIFPSVRVPETLRGKIGKAIRGETNDPIFNLTEEDVAILSCVAHTIESLLSEADNYEKSSVAES